MTKLKSTYNIKILNIRSLSSNLEPSYFFIGRPNTLGNPFYLKSEKERDEVVLKYRKYLWKKIKAKDSKICSKLNEIKQYYLQKGEVSLVCWCAPKKCHGDVIKNCLIWMIENNIILMV